MARIYGYDDKLRPGAYSFTVGMSDDEVFAKLLTGEKRLIKFTVPEGFGVKEIAARLANLDLVDKDEFLKAAANFAPYDYMRKRRDVFFATEGFLFPETYSVENDVEVDELLTLMTKTFDEKLTPTMRTQAEKLGLSVYDLITLASLVEREVRFPEDRPIVAQVFLKRLKLNIFRPFLALLVFHLCFLEFYLYFVADRSGHNHYANNYEEHINLVNQYR